MGFLPITYGEEPYPGMAFHITDHPRSREKAPSRLFILRSSSEFYYRSPALEGGEPYLQKPPKRPCLLHGAIIFSMRSIDPG